MCGINGILGIEDPEKGKLYLAKMNAKMAHRGPDDEGMYVDVNIAVGQRRLSIIDLSSGGHQPMWSNDKRYCIVYNGELYNFKELRFDLERASRGSEDKPYHFITASDTEVILAAYSRWGKECLKKFNGMYGFAIWDVEKKELFIARDRLGIKPIYYSYKNQVLAFSSEIRSLLESEIVPRKLNNDALVDYLRYQTVHAPNTMVKDVFMLMPGHYMIAKHNDITIEKYWDINQFVGSKKTDIPYTEVCAKVNNLFEKAVQRRLVADVPFGAFLSGGIDSSAVVGMMSKVSTSKVKTFSVVFEDEKYSEAKYARIIANKFNTEHHEIKLTPNDFKNELNGALHSMDHPSGDGPNTYVVSKATKNAGITMALSGLGGDELFAGYDIFNRTLKLEKLKWLSGIPGIALAAKFNKLIRPSISSSKIAELLEQNSLSFKNTYPLSRQVLLEDQIKKLMSGKTAAKNSVAEIIKNIKAQSGNLISAVGIAEISTYMQNVLLRDTDQMSMAHALEIRVPFLDYELVEYVVGLPDVYKIPTSPKKLLVDAMGDLLPPEIVNRPKMGFTLPWKNWLKSDFKSLCETNLKLLGQNPHFNAKELEDQWQRFLKDDPMISWSRIWYLVVLQHWITENNIEVE
jgi:asparagine synthase (glutamine-hydrolysing)